MGGGGVDPAFCRRHDTTTGNARAIFPPLLHREREWDRDLTAAGFLRLESRITKKQTIMSAYFSLEFQRKIFEKQMFEK